MNKKIMLLGSGELGKEVVIALKRLGQYVIAVDNYENAPAMQVADACEVIDMLNAAKLNEIVKQHQPDIIVPEIEAIRTEEFYNYEQQNIQVVPSAKAANYTMNRKLVRDLAAKELGLKTAKYLYADDLHSFANAVATIGLPCVAKPLISSSGKGQSVVRTIQDIKTAWQYACSGSRGDLMEVIVEEFIPFDAEITLLTVTQKSGNTLFCSPIGHRQERGDYQESWQPCLISNEHLLEAQQMAAKITKALGGCGIWGVEFFLTQQGVYFSELSPRPHDTGMVTLAGTQNFNEFELHVRAILGIPIPSIQLLKAGCSAVILAKAESNLIPQYQGLNEALQIENSDIKIFGKPTTRLHRRMGVALAHDTLQSDMNNIRKKAKQMADLIIVN
jgi:phosphoribosylglycinamide formyltransferase 2